VPLQNISAFGRVEGSFENLYAGLNPFDSAQGRLKTKSCPSKTFLPSTERKILFENLYAGLNPFDFAQGRSCSSTKTSF
jgi:hypothetical protein